jgi:hypothetical protein
MSIIQEMAHRPQNENNNKSQLRPRLLISTSETLDGADIRWMTLPWPESDQESLHHLDHRNSCIRIFHCRMNDRARKIISVGLLGKVFWMHILFLVFQMAQATTAKQVKPIWTLLPNFLCSQFINKSSMDLGYPSQPKASPTNAHTNSSADMHYSG